MISQVLPLWDSLTGRRSGSSPRGTPDEMTVKGTAPRRDALRIDGSVRISGRLDLNQRPFGPQPSGFRRLCVSERPSFPMCPGPWTIWTDRTVHPVPKRYHGAGSQSGPPVKRALNDRNRFHAKRVVPDGSRDTALTMSEQNVQQLSPAIRDDRSHALRRRVALKLRGSCAERGRATECSVSNDS
jgi:hypothetical protein